MKLRPTWHSIATGALLYAVSAGAAGSVAPNPAATVRVLRDQDAAVLRVGELLVTAGRRLCASSGYSAGMTVQTASQYGGAYRAAARTELKIADLPTVAAIAPGSAAAAAGLMIGDQIMAIDDHRFVAGRAEGGKGNFSATAAALDSIDAALADGSATLRIERSSGPVTVVVTPRPACRARFDVRAGQSSNATSDGITIQVSSDLVADAEGDGELGAILAHELAHNILRHPQRLKAHEPELSVRVTEVEADRLSIWLLDAAGFGPGPAVSFWSRWGRAHDFGIFADRSHPGWRARVRTIEAEATIIVAARAAGRPLLPPGELRPR